MDIDTACISAFKLPCLYFSCRQQTPTDRADQWARTGPGWEALTADPPVRLGGEDDFLPRRREIGRRVRRAAFRRCYRYRILNFQFNTAAVKNKASFRQLLPVSNLRPGRDPDFRETVTAIECAPVDPWRGIAGEGDRGQIGAVSKRKKPNCG